MAPGLSLLANGYISSILFCPPLPLIRYSLSLYSFIADLAQGCQGPLSAWVAGDDVDTQNGCMRFIPTSHKLNNIAAVPLSQNVGMILYPLISSYFSSPLLSPLTPFRLLPKIFLILTLQKDGLAHARKHLGDALIDSLPTPVDMIMPAGMLLLFLILRFPFLFSSLVSLIINLKPCR